MIIVPELKLVLLTPPRCGSTSVREALLEQYPDAMALYRHRERDGIPPEYAEDFSIACMVRHPLQRMWSLYKYMKTFPMEKWTTPDGLRWIKGMHEDTRSVSFGTWALRSNHKFHNRKVGGPYYRMGRYDIPIVRRSLRTYAQPHLGPVEILKLEDKTAIRNRLGIDLPKLNGTHRILVPTRLPRAEIALRNWHSWDYSLYEGGANAVNNNNVSRSSDLLRSEEPAPAGAISSRSCHYDAGSQNIRK